MDNVKIGAVIVLYNPTIKEINAALDKLQSQVDLICLVDNSSVDNGGKININNKVNYIPLKENVGIAKAQNIGIKYLIETSCDFAVFSDQDSLVSEGVIQKLYKSYIALEQKGIAVGVVGTKAINKATMQPYPPKSKFIRKIEVVNEGVIYDISEYYSVISSISLISISSLTPKIVGGFDEKLFIDGVDHEWCWRAWHNYGLRSFVVENALLYHQLGEGDRTIAGKEIAISSSKRLYYQYRNYLWLCRRKYVPSYWKKKNGIKYMVKAFYYPVFISPRYKNLVNILKGLYDGLFTR